MIAINLSSIFNAFYFYKTGRIWNAKWVAWSWRSHSFELNILQMNEKVGNFSLLGKVIIIVYGRRKSHFYQISLIGKFWKIQLLPAETLYTFWIGYAHLCIVSARTLLTCMLVAFICASGIKSLLLQSSFLYSSENVYSLSKTILKFIDFVPELQVGKIYMQPICHIWRLQNICWSWRNEICWIP